MSGLPPPPLSRFRVACCAVSFVGIRHLTWGRVVWGRPFRFPKRTEDSGWTPQDPDQNPTQHTHPNQVGRATNPLAVSTLAALPIALHARRLPSFATSHARARVFPLPAMSRKFRAGPDAVARRALDLRDTMELAATTTRCLCCCTCVVCVCVCVCARACVCSAGERCVRGRTDAL
jgi:hypothetical protein